MPSTQSTNCSPDQHPFPDVILKSQFFGQMGRRALSSEQRLMLAVLADAINVVQEGMTSTLGRQRRRFAEARNWIFQSDIPCPLAFENVCDALGIDPEALRWRIGSLISGASVQSPIARLRLRLKEATRMQRLTVNRVRHHHRRHGALAGHP